MVTYKELKIVKKNIEPKLFSIPGVVGVGLGVEKTGVLKIGEIEKKIFVDVEKITTKLLKQIPSEINGIPIVIKEIGKVGFLSIPTPKKDTNQWRKEWRPVFGGAHIGSGDLLYDAIEDTWGRVAGTLGLNVIDNTTGKEVLLSCRHVLYDERYGYEKNKIYQPALEEPIAILTRWNNKRDCAIATPLSNIKLSEKILYDYKSSFWCFFYNSGETIQAAGQTVLHT